MMKMYLQIDIEVPYIITMKINEFLLVTVVLEVGVFVVFVVASMLLPEGVVTDSVGINKEASDTDEVAGMAKVVGTDGDTVTGKDDIIDGTDNIIDGTDDITDGNVDVSDTDDE